MPVRSGVAKQHRLTAVALLQTVKEYLAYDREDMDVLVAIDMVWWSTGGVFKLLQLSHDFVT